MSKDNEWVVVECAPNEWLAPTTTNDTSDWITPSDSGAENKEDDWIYPDKGSKKDWIAPQFEKPEDEWIRPEHGDMFFTYDYMDKHYVPDNIHPKCECQPRIPFQVGQSHILRNKLGEFRGFTWEEGQPVRIDFKYSGCYPFIDSQGEEMTYAQFLKDKDIHASIYNFRMEELQTSLPLEKLKCDTLSLILDAKLSEGLIKGLYYIKIEALDISNSIVQLDNLVIINPGDIVLLVR